MSVCQAQAENLNVLPLNEATSGYWYTSSVMSGDICLNSCLKYNFVYAGIKAK
jgi:hypothetical protein